MGLLDDAIREHLELKRRRGADEAEVSRQENEALGGPQQRAEFAETPQPDPATDEPELVDEPEPAEEPVDEIPLDQPTVEYEPDLGPEPEVGPEPEPEPEAAARDSDDVLEETPEFLQETPEHDRLWFEQKPPRDFDLDR